MIQVNLLTAVLAIEALAGLIVALLFLLYRRSSKSRSEHAEAVALVDRINQEDEAHEQHLADSLSVLDDTGPLDDSMRRATVEAVLNKEKALYRLAIQAFLSRDAKKLAEIDQHVRGLSEPYCQLIQQLLKQAPPGEARAEPAPDARTADLQAELKLVKAKAETTKAQLDSAFAGWTTCPRNTRGCSVPPTRRKPWPKASAPCRRFSSARWTPPKPGSRPRRTAACLKAAP